MPLSVTKLVYITRVALPEALLLPDQQLHEQRCIKTPVSPLCSLPKTC